MIKTKQDVITLLDNLKSTGMALIYETDEIETIVYYDNAWKVKTHVENSIVKKSLADYSEKTLIEKLFLERKLINQVNSRRSYFF